MVVLDNSKNISNYMSKIKKHDSVNLKIKREMFKYQFICFWNTFPMGFIYFVIHYLTKFSHPEILIYIWIFFLVLSIIKINQIRNQLAIPSDVLVALFKDSEDNENLRDFLFHYLTVKIFCAEKT
ncbi:hypothetical protein B4R02_14320 [Salmonella enterica]|nr:hypothetical protein [Salmonella enterica subsp. diarizonae serovar 42:l,v:1,5,7]